MPRQIAWKPRLIHPSGSTSVSLARVSALAELLWWKLVPQCDDQGRMFGDSQSIKSACCPLRNELNTDNIPLLLEELNRAELVILYSNSTTLLLQIKNWWEYESPQWAYPSKISPPPNWHDKLRYRKGNKVIKDNWRETKSDSEDE